ncbi:MAG: tagatose 1,6-diphosphate aldolase [Anaerolineae bacterium]
MTTLGKYRHLSRCSTPNGHFSILAIDHRAILLESLNKHAPQPLTDAQFTSFKQQVVGALAPHASAVLVDPGYGIGAGIASQTISGQVGLLSPVEVTEYNVHPSLRPIQFIEGWSVEKIKRVGGDGVKMLLYYHPEAAEVQAKHEAVQRIIEDCRRYDLPFFLEPIPYSLDINTALTNTEIRQISVSMAETFSDMGVDVLKMQFPTGSDDEREWVSACAELNAACRVPWALLSAGVSFETFLRQAEVACDAGASGVIVGRAVWAEAVTLQGAERAHFIQTTGIERMQALAAVCAQNASPWFIRTDKPDHAMNWYESY